MMANEEEPPAAEWEVVSLTTSTYAASPDPRKLDMTGDEATDSAGVDVVKTSDPMLMSGHFVFPPSLHENLPLQPESNEIHSLQEDEGTGESEDFGCKSITDEGIQSEMKDQDKINFEGLDLSDDFPGMHFNEKGSILSVGAAQFEGGDALPGLSLLDEDHNVYSHAQFSSLCSELNVSDITAIEESSIVAEVTEGLVSSISSSPKSTDKGDDAYNLPCGAWWKRKAVSLYAHAREANTLWSMFIAAAVMGLVILGQRWQQENWQLLQLRWQFSVNDEKLGRVLSPLTRFKDVLVGGHRPGSFIKGSASVDH